MLFVVMDDRIAVPLALFPPLALPAPEILLHLRIHSLALNRCPDVSVWSLLSGGDAFQSWALLVIDLQPICDLLF